jgi:general secretion pathway protein A
MYLSKYNLNEEPFSTSPDPKYLYKSGVHQEALDRLVTSVSMRRGINAIIGEPGLGKSTLIRTMLHGFQSSVNYAWVFNTTLNSREIYRYICRDFGFTPSSTDLSDLLIELYTFFVKEHEKGRTAVLIIDEAQNLKPQVLEEIRQLSNLETVNKKLVQIILSGQPQLDAYLDHPTLHQLKQRISLKAVLTRLGMDDTKKYIRYRLAVAGAAREDIFTDAALNAIYDITDGVPRLINQVCDNALLETLRTDADQVDSILIAELVEKGLVTLASSAKYKPAELFQERNTVENNIAIQPKSAKRNKANTNSNLTFEMMEASIGEFDSVDLSELTI